METGTNENNMLAEKMHICFKNIIVSEHGFEHVSYVTRYVFGEVTEEENKRNRGWEADSRVISFTATWPKGGNVTLENWELKISKFRRVEGNLDLLFSLLTEVKNQKILQL